LWTGSGFSSSEASGVSDGQQVGVGFTADGAHALLWTGSAESVVDLNAFLPPGFTEAFAFGIDAEGNIVGTAFGPAGSHAILWKPTVVPEPSTIVLFGIGLTGIVIAGWRRQTA
jgi:PEP-CTERM motif